MLAQILRIHGLRPWPPRGLRNHCRIIPPDSPDCPSPPPHEHVGCQMAQGLTGHNDFVEYRKLSGQPADRLSDATIQRRCHGVAQRIRLNCRRELVFEPRDPSQDPLLGDRIDGRLRDWRPK
jgi:hypothetical protein